MKFSIITCTYNSEKYVQNNINSVKNQTFKDFEHIFIDGFSTDKTLSILKKYQKKCPEQVSTYRVRPRGIANAMNEGIKKAQGDYIIHLHSDDSFYSLDTLKEVSAFIKKNNKPDWVYGKAKFINTETGSCKIIPHRKIYQKARFSLLMITNYIPHQSVFIKRSQFKKYGLFDESLKNVMDYEFWLRLTKNKVRSSFIDEIICNFSVRPDAQSMNPIGQKEELYLVEKYIRNPLISNLLKKIHEQNQKRSFF